MKKEKVCFLKLDMPGSTKKGKTIKDQAVFIAPDDWVITSYKPVITGELGTNSYSIDKAASNSRYVSILEIDNSYEEAMSLAANLGYTGEQLAELNGELNTSFSDLKNFRSEISATNATVTLFASVSSQGFGKGGSEIEIYVEVEIKEIPSQIRSKNSVKSHFKSIIDGFVANNEIVPHSEEVVEGQVYKDIITASNIIQTSRLERFLVNKHNQLIRSHDTEGKVEIIAPTNPVKKGTLRYSEEFKTIFALTDEKDSNILVVRKVNGKWLTGIVNAWGSNILPNSFTLQKNDFGVIGVNEDGYYVSTYGDKDAPELPGGNRLSFSVGKEIKDIV